MYVRDYINTNITMRNETVDVQFTKSCEIILLIYKMNPSLQQRVKKLTKKQPREVNIFTVFLFANCNINFLSSKSLNLN